MTEQATGITLFDNLVSELKTKPEETMVHTRITQGDLNVLMKQLLTSSLKVPGLKIEANIDTKIAQQHGIVSGSISVDHPLAGHSWIGLSLMLGNSAKTLGLIETNSQQVKTDISSRARIFLQTQGVNVDTEIAESLSNPHKALMKLFTTELGKQGLFPTRLEGVFTPDNSLDIGIKCKRISKNPNK